MSQVDEDDIVALVLYEEVGNESIGEDLIILSKNNSILLRKSNEENYRVYSDYIKRFEKDFGKPVGSVAEENSLQKTSRMFTIEMKFSDVKAMIIKMKNHVVIDVSTERFMMSGLLISRPLLGEHLLSALNIFTGRLESAIIPIGETVH
jgi:hypothetical protein